jgi:glycosyltransferase involved in cell wall biosynthesis
MNKDILIIQRFYYNFREGFYEYLSDINFGFKIINATTSKGRVKVHDGATNLPYILKIFHFFIGDNYVIFPFLFFNLIHFDPKIIVTEGGQNTINNFQVLLYCKIFKRKYIIWDLGKGYADFGVTRMRKLYMKFYKLILKHASLIYGYNSQSKKYFKSIGFDESKLVILNNTIDTRKIRKLRAEITQEIPSELMKQSKEGYLFFIFVGTLLKSKNIETLTELLGQLGKGYFLMIVGDGDAEYKAELQVMFEGTNHIFVGYRKLEQLIPYYKLASFSILPGLGGLSINQSMAFGVPVICSGADGAEMDLVIADETGYIYKDLNDACNFIKSKSPEDWKRMGKKCETFLYTFHNIETMMDKFVYHAISQTEK